MKDQIFAELGDVITLYSIENDEIIEFCLGDKSFPGIDDLCLNKSIRDKFSFTGETFIIQYIEKGNGISISDKKQNPRSQKVLNSKPKIKKKSAVTIKKSSNNEVGVHDFIVRTNIYRCLDNSHKLVPVNAVVNMIKNNMTVNRSFPGMYCSKCDKYFLYENTYQAMKREGYICCKVIKREDMNFYNSDSNSPFGNWQQQSILNLYGYSVDKNKGLTDKQRQMILAFIIENDILSSHKVVDYLESFITLRKHNKRMQAAISKWRADISYVLNYEKGNTNIRVKSIIIPK